MGAADGDILLLDELLTDDERELRDRVRAFCDEHVRPVINDYWERAEFPFELVPKLASLRIAGGWLRTHGGPGMTHLAAGLAVMELARCDGSIATFHGVHSGLALRAIAMLGSAEQKDRWLPAMTRLERIGAFALTEPDHGSDVVNLETRARREGDEWVLNGRKRWIGNATFADIVVVWARDDDGEVGGFVVERGASPGFAATPITGKIAKRASVQAEVALEDVRVPLDNRLAGARTFADTASVLAAARPGVAWGALGHAVGAYEVALSHVQTREQFGAPLAGHQLVQEKLARMLAAITGMRLVCMRVSELLSQRKLTPAMSSLAKMQCARSARAVVADARDLMGGSGILLENHVARHFVDLEVTYTVEGTDHVQALIVGREITGIPAFG